MLIDAEDLKNFQLINGILINKNTYQIMTHTFAWGVPHIRDWYIQTFPAYQFVINNESIREWVRLYDDR